jgi:hypothetical protein
MGKRIVDPTWMPGSLPVWNQWNGVGLETPIMEEIFLADVKTAGVGGDVLDMVD